MSSQVVIALSFILFLLLFVGVGIYSASQKQNNTTDYLLASRSVNPWLTGLSAFATAHSGGMFISTIGWTYQVGISSVWLLVGWFLGDYLAWFFVHKPLRISSEATGSETIGAFLGQNNQDRSIPIISALVTIAFLGAYAAAQLLAGSKALYAVFGWNYSWGIFLGAVIVVSYCFSGGIRASIWTDAVQSVLMVFAMMMLLFVAISACGGITGMWQQLAAIDPTLVNPIPPNLKFGFALFMLSWLAAGVGVVGQPHIMVRAMVLDNAENIGITRNIYAVSYVVFSTAAVLVGLSARVLLPGLIDGGDPELALPQMATELLPALLVGVILAGIFSAVISTADSQILSCSAALTQDLFPKMSGSYKLVKVGTLIVTAIIVAIALTSNKNMFALGVFAWSALACGLAPLLMLRVWQFSVNSVVGVTMMVVGIATAAIWNGVLGLSGSIYEVLPGAIASFAVYGIARLFTFQKKFN
ncbi:sodium/proline symporter [Myxosarcina sp. GI1]|uniref:sodium/proline symporter n=1 Tax=Myxosarcina sp. GI1 TaxID=1541065 RepID=UPI00055F93BD|nr:sodium/proline symporter [Myxosarcina sp. GI1]